MGSMGRDVDPEVRRRPDRGFERRHGPSSRTPDELTRTPAKPCARRNASAVGLRARFAVQMKTTPNDVSGASARFRIRGRAWRRTTTGPQTSAARAWRGRWNSTVDVPTRDSSSRRLRSVAGGRSPHPTSAAPSATAPISDSPVNGSVLAGAAAFSANTSDTGPLLRTDRSPTSLLLPKAAPASTRNMALTVRHAKPARHCTSFTITLHYGFPHPFLVSPSTYPSKTTLPTLPGMAEDARENRTEPNPTPMLPCSIRWMAGRS